VAGAHDLSGCVVRVHAPEPRTVRPTEDEARRALAIPHLAARWVITCALDIGLRHKTAEAITPRHLSEDGSAILTATKRGRVIRLPTTPRLSDLIRLARPGPDETDVRFVDLLNNRAIVQGPQTIGQAWCRWKKQVGLPPDLRIHDLRRDFAHRAYGAARDVREVQAALGHETPITTLRYLHLVVQTATVMAALLPERKTP
jgi:integrase/recombinase XerC